MRVLVVVVALSTAAAAAPPPRPPTQDVTPTVFLGTGVEFADGYGDHLSSCIGCDSDRALAIEAMLGVHMSPGFSIGVHAGAARLAYHDDFNGSMFDSTTDAKLVPVDLGLAFQYDWGHSAVTPWVGRRITRRSVYHLECPSSVTKPCTSSDTTEWSNDAWAYGVTASVAVLRSGRNRLSAFVAVRAGDYVGTTIGLAFHR